MGWRGVARHTLVRGSFEVRYFEIAPGGFSSLEKHAHVHAVFAVRGRGRALVGDEVVELTPLDLVQTRAVGAAPVGRTRATSRSGSSAPSMRERDRPQPLDDAEWERAAGRPAHGAVRTLSLPASGSSRRSGSSSSVISALSRLAHGCSCAARIVERVREVARGVVIGAEQRHLVVVHARGGDAERAVASAAAEQVHGPAGCGHRHRELPRLRPSDGLDHELRAAAAGERAQALDVLGAARGEDRVRGAEARTPARAAPGAGRARSARHRPRRSARTASGPASRRRGWPPVRPRGG